MSTFIPGDYSKTKDYFNAMFKKLGTQVVEVPLIKVKPGRKPRADKGKSHNYPEAPKKKVGRPKGKPRWPRKPKVEVVKPNEVEAHGFFNKYLKK